MTEKRLVVVLCVLTAFAFLIELNMVYINTSGRYEEKAESQQYRVLDIDDGRAPITDCNFNNITNTTERYKTLVAAYDGDLQQVFNALTEGEKRNFYDNIQYKSNFIAELKMPVDGRKVYTVTDRYSNFNIAQHLIGYTDSEGNGVSGMEQVFDDKLKDGAKVRYIQANVNGYGEIIEGWEKDRIDNSDGVSKLLSLTIDNTVQRLCEGVAKEYIPNGSIVVMESKTGKIKAMVSTPYYSANNVAQALQADNSPLVNKSLQTYESGSVIKPLWAAVLLENGYSPGRIYNCTGTIEVGDHEYHCANNKAHGEVDMEKALVVSCNCYFINAKIKNKGFNFNTTAKALFFGDKLQLTQDYNTKAGYFPTTVELEDLGQLASISFGQGKMLVTPVHITAYMNVFANGGRYVYPQVAEGIYNSETKEQITDLYSYNSKQILEKETADKVKNMLKSVVEQGSGERAKPEHLSAGGKTGTAQTGRFDENGEEIMTAWFCGFYPYDNPQYTICITIYNGGESSYTTTPIFKKICDSLYYLL